MDMSMTIATEPQTAPLTTIAVAKTAGISYRQLDHMVRSGVVEPRDGSQGSGYPRTWGAEQVPVLRLVAVLRDHGARYDTIRAVVPEAEALPEAAWNARVLVTKDGRIVPLLSGDANGWSVDLAHCRLAAA